MLLHIKKHLLIKGHCGTPFNSIIMEYADDGDLLQKIKELNRTKKNFTENEIWKLFIQVDCTISRYLEG